METNADSARRVVSAAAGIKRRGIQRRHSETSPISLSIAALLAKFRIDFSDVKVIPDVTKRAQDSTRAELTSLIHTLPEGKQALSTPSVYLSFFPSKL
jgi:hypothetical protein